MCRTDRPKVEERPEWKRPHSSWRMCRVGKKKSSRVFAEQYRRNPKLLKTYNKEKVMKHVTAGKDKNEI